MLLVVLPVDKCSVYWFCIVIIWMRINVFSSIELQMLLSWQGLIPTCNKIVTVYWTLRHITWTKALLDEQSSFLLISEGQGEQPNISSGSGLAWHINLTSTQYSAPLALPSLEMHHKTVTWWRHFLPHKKSQTERSPAKPYGWGLLLKMLAPSLLTGSVKIYRAPGDQWIKHLIKSLKHNGTKISGSAWSPLVIRCDKTVMWGN